MTSDELAWTRWEQELAKEIRAMTTTAVQVGVLRMAPGKE